MFNIWSTRIWYNIILMASLLPLVYSCNMSKTQEIESVDEFYTISTDTIVPLFSSYSQPSCHLQLRYEVPSKCVSNDVLTVADEVIISLTQDVNALEKGSNIEEMAKEYTNAYILNYLSEGKDAIDNYEGDMEATSNWMCYEEIRTGKVIYNKKGFLSYSVSLYSYTGGAHGISSNRVATIDLNASKQLHLYDIVSDESKPNLRKILLQQLAEQNELENVESLRESNYFFNVDEIDLTENFYLSEEGITFIYDPIEIAPYSSGEISVTLDWNRLRDIVGQNSNLSKFIIKE